MESLWNQVFQNPIILSHIFQFFPTSSLLKRYSLVNKFWNKEVRTFVRDHRKCSALRPTSVENECEFLQKLDELCCLITEHGRVIPYNSLKLSMPWHLCEDLQHPSWLAFGDFKSELKIKYLDIHWFFTHSSDCSVHHSLMALLRRNAPHLKRLKIEEAAPQFEKMLTESPFPLLEEIFIYRKSHYDEALAADKQILLKLLESAPNCKKIRVSDYRTLCTAVPQDKYGLLTELECSGSLYGNTFGYESLLPKVMEDIIAKNPAVKKLRIRPPVATITGLQLFSLTEDMKAVLAENYAKKGSVFKTILLQSLQRFRQSLRTISIQRRYPLAQLPSPSLLNVRKLVLKDDLLVSEGTERFWTLIVSADLARRMPRLIELKIIISTLHLNVLPGLLEESSVVWPDCDHVPDGSTYYECGRIRKLTLDLQVKQIEFSRIRSFFPNVKSLELIMEFGHHTGSDPLPISQVSECWPDLEELNIHGAYNFLGRNYDADFCGVHEEEAEMLRTADDDYLKAVHIVPTRPCLLTMQSMKLYMKLGNF